MIPTAAVLELGAKLVLAGIAAWENKEAVVTKEKLLAISAGLVVEQAKWADIFPDLFAAPGAAPVPPAPEGTPTP